MQDSRQSRQAEHQRKYRRGVKTELAELHTKLDDLCRDLDQRFAGLLDTMTEQQRASGRPQ